MKQWIAVAAVVVSMSASGSAQASTVKYDYDKSVDFTAWKSLAWKPSGPSGGTLAEGRIRRALAAGFAAKGYTMVDASSADFLVAHHAAARRDLRVSESFSRGFGRDLRVDSVPVGFLVVDVFERRTGKLAWRGMVSDALASNPEKADKRTEKAVAKLLEKFPPAGDS